MHQLSKMKKTLALIALFGSSFIAASPLASAAGVLLTYAEAPAAMNTTLSGASVFNFDSSFAGTTVAQSPLLWSGVGSYDSVSVIGANRFGGAGGTGYYLVQSQSVGAQVVTTTLSLNTPSSYFGLWWSAGDNRNRLQFYNGSSLVADFTTQTLVSVLPSTYSGNPNAAFAGQNSGEKYAFLNVYSNDGTTFDRIVFSNVGSSGFESDNHTVRTAAWGTLPGETGPAPGVPVAIVNGTTVTPVVAVPETSTWVMGVLAAGAVFFFVRRRKATSN